MKKREIKYKSFAFSACFTLICIIFSLIWFESMSLGILIHKLCVPMLRLLMFITIGLIAGQAIETMGWTKQMAVVARPFFAFSRLGDRCGAAFTSAFISGATANAMLLEFYEEQKISKMQLFLSNYVNQFPAFFLHLPTTVFIVLPLTGFAGILYFVITFLATLFRTICFLIFGRIWLSQEKPTGSKEDVSRETMGRKPSATVKTVLKNIQQKLPRRVINIAIWVLPIYTIVFILNLNGFFDYLNRTLAGSMPLSFIPVESLSVIVLSFAAEFTSGFAAAGALMDAGVITTKQTVIALLLGNVLAFPIRALRHQLPRYMGIFAPKMGLELLLSGQLFRVLSIILIGTLYYMAA